MRFKLSILILAEDADKQLYDCISHVESIADEIIIIGRQKKGNYQVKAEGIAVRIYEGKWDSDYGAILPYLIGKAEGDWILILNSCEKLHLSSNDNLNFLMENKEVQAYYLQLANFAERDEELPLKMELSLRMIKKNKCSMAGLVLEEILDSVLDLNSGIRIGIAADPIIFSREDNCLKNKQNRLLSAIEEEPDKLAYRYYLGLVYYQQNRFDMALDCFWQVYNQRKGHPVYLADLMRRIALSQYAKGDIEKSLSFIDNQWMEILPKMMDIYYIKGIIHKKTGNYKEAYRAFSRFRILSEETEEYPEYFNIYHLYHDRVFYYLGNLAEYFMDFNQSLNYYYKSLNCNPFMLTALEKMISILKPRQNPEYTLKALNQIFDLSDEKIQRNLAFIFYKQGAYQLALKSLPTIRKGANISESNRLLAGLCLLRGGLFAKAVIELGAISKDKKLFIKAQQYLLLYYTLLNDQRNIKNCRERIRAVSGDSLLVKILTVFTGGKTELPAANFNNEQAQAIIREILEFVVEMGSPPLIDDVSKNMRVLIGVRPCLLFAELFYQYEKYDLAIKEYSQLVEFGQTDARTIYYLGKSYWGIGNLAKAQFYLQQASEKGLDTPRLNRELIYLYQQLAIGKLKKEVSHSPENTDLAQILDQMKASLLET